MLNFFEFLRFNFTGEKQESALLGTRLTSKYCSVGKGSERRKSERRKSKKNIKSLKIWKGSERQKSLCQKERQKQTFDVLIFFDALGKSERQKSNLKFDNFWSSEFGWVSLGKVRLHLVRLGAIQKIRDTLGGRGGG